MEIHIHTQRSVHCNGKPGQSLTGKYHGQTTNSHFLLTIPNTVYSWGKNIRSLFRFILLEVLLYILAVAHRDLNRHPMKDEMGNIYLSQYKLQIFCYCIDILVCNLFNLNFVKIQYVYVSSSSCGSLTRRTACLMYGDSEVIFFLFSNLDLSLLSVTNKALQPVGWGNAFWMFPHTHSLPHLLNPPQPPSPYPAPQASSVQTMPVCQCDKKSFPWSRSLCWLCSCLPLRSCAPDDGRPRYGFNFLLTFLPPSATPSSISLPLSLTALCWIPVISLHCW